MKPFINLLDYFQRFRTLSMNRMVPPSVMERDSLTFWRVNVLFAILFTALVLCTLAIGAAILLAIKESVWRLVIFDVLGYVICISLLLSRRLSYGIRAAVTLLMFYIVGLAVIASVGPLSGGPVWLFTFAVLVGVLLGSKAAMVAIAVNGITLTIIAWLLSTGQFGHTFPFFNTSQVMVSAGVNFIVLNAIAAMSVSVLVKGFVSSHQKEKVLLSSIEQERVHLIEAKKGLELEVEERKQAEEALRESEKRFKDLYQKSPIPTFTWQKKDEDFILVHFNRAALQLNNGKAVDRLGNSALKVYRNNPQVFSDMNLCYKEQSVVRREIVSQHFAPGRILSVHYAFIPPDMIIVHAEDQTELKRSEEELKTSKVQLSNALEMACLGHWEYDVANDLFTFNDQFYRLFRTTVEQVGGYTMHSAEYAHRFVHPDDMDIVGEETRKAIETTDFHFNRQIEHRILYADGTVGYISVWFFIVKDDHGCTVKAYGVNQDITDRKRMEEEFLRLDKLESIGVLAGGIAHDFNNILATILGNVSMAKNQVKPGDEIFDLLNDAEMASTRAQTLTKQLLTFAKGGAPLKETASIKDIIIESCSFVLRGSRARSELSIAEDLWPAEVDVGQISQVINNIVINANQAMPQGGLIQVSSENLIVEDRHGLLVKPGRYIKISITDQGVGILEKHLLHIFDPYFTTKQEGSGLGLATTYSIIKKHDGHITVESQLGVGTTFHIYLPASEKALPEKEEVRLIKGQGKILVMDDEASLRKMVGRMLERLGYEPEFAKDGAEAVQMVKKAKESEKPYDAVILDLTIPGGMGGKEAIDKLLKIDPEVKAIVSSGYSDDPVLADFQEYGFKGMMPKPFEFQSLGKVLHEVIKGEKE